MVDTTFKRSSIVFLDHYRNHSCSAAHVLTQGPPADLPWCQIELTLMLMMNGVADLTPYYPQDSNQVQTDQRKTLLPDAKIRNPAESYQPYATHKGFFLQLHYEL